MTGVTQVVCGFGFILGEEQPRRGEVKVVEIGLPDDVAKRNRMVLLSIRRVEIGVAQRIVDRSTLGELDLGAIAE